MQSPRFARLRRWSLAALLVVCAGTPVTAASTKFFSRDLNTSGNGTPIASHPNADGARNAFLAAISSPVTNDLESDAPNGNANQSFTFGSTTVTTRALSGGGLRNSATSGTYAVSGSQHVFADAGSPARMAIDFSPPVSAFGCYLTGVGDHLSEDTMRATLSFIDDSTETIDIVSQIGFEEPGSVSYLGVVHGEATISRITLASPNDEFGVDDITISSVVGGGGGGGGPAPSVAEVDAYFLPKNVRLTTNTANPAKSVLRAIGTFDIGSRPDRDLSKPATITIGQLAINAPGFTASADGTKYVYTTPEFTFVVKRAKTHSSKGRFILTLKRDLTGVVDPNARLDLRFVSADVDAGGSMQLANGRYRVGLVRGALFAPDISFYRLTATNKGAGKDAFELRGAIASGGNLYAEASDVTVALEGYTETVPASAFTKKEDGYFVYTGSLGGTIRKISLDWRRERLIVSARNLTFPEIEENGDDPLDVRIVVGGMDRTAHVRVFRRGTKVAY